MKATMGFISGPNDDMWPDMAGIGDALGGATAILDGEMVVIGDDGRPSFDLVQKRADLRRHPR